MIKIDFSDFTSKLKQMKELAGKEQLELNKKITADVHTNVVLGSPVDTGNFRAAWTVELPNKPFENGKVENTTPYGPALARGHSQQAPNGWIENAVEAATKLGD